VEERKSASVCVRRPAREESSFVATALEKKAGNAATEGGEGQSQKSRRSEKKKGTPLLLC